MECRSFNNQCIKKGFQKNGTQKFQCTICKKYQQNTYCYKAYLPETRQRLTPMIKRGLGIIDMACLLEVSKNTVMSYIKNIALNLTPPKAANGQIYECDEFHTIIRGQHKQVVYVAYVMNRFTYVVLNFCVGSRDQFQLKKMLQPVLKSTPKRIYTDGWASYPCIIPEKIHCCIKYLINKIERNHLTLRTQIKRVSKNFMHQSRSIEMLIAYLTIYFWG